MRRSLLQREMAQADLRNTFTKMPHESVPLLSLSASGQTDDYKVNIKPQGRLLSNPQPLQPVPEIMHSDRASTITASHNNSTLTPADQHKSVNHSRESGVQSDNAAFGTHQSEELRFDESALQDPIKIVVHRSEDLVAP